MNLPASMASETQDESHSTTPSTGLLQNIKRNALKQSLELPLLMQGKHSLCSSNVSPLDEQPCSSLNSECIEMSRSKNKTRKFCSSNLVFWQSSYVFRTPRSPVVYRITESLPPGGHFSSKSSKGLIEEQGGGSLMEEKGGGGGEWGRMFEGITGHVFV
nr:hypothetical protein PanWU01x14_284780 [Ipomoea batatas]